MIHLWISWFSIILVGATLLLYLVIVVALIWHIVKDLF